MFKTLNIEKHYIELKFRILYVLLNILFNILITCKYSDEILYIIASNKIYFSYFISTSFIEVFVTKLTIAAYTAIILAYPIFLIATCTYLCPGLHKTEAKKVKNLLAYLFFVFFFSIYISHKFLIPLTWEFFMQFEPTKGIDLFLEIKLIEYLDYYLNLQVITLLSSQIMVIFLYFFAHIHLHYLIKTRKMFYFIFFLFSTLITPPDILSQIILGLLGIICYEIICIKRIIKKEYGE